MSPNVRHVPYNVWVERFASVCPVRARACVCVYCMNIYAPPQKKKLFCRTTAGFIYRRPKSLRALK